MVMRQETGRPVRFEITQMTRDSILAWIKHTYLDPSDYIFPGRVYESPHRSTRQYARIVHRWVEAAGPDSSESAARWLCIEMDDALEIAEHTDV